jgi:hypothetical protein
MVDETTVLELRKDAALLARFKVTGVPFGFTTIPDGDTKDYVSWIFIGDVNCTIDTEGTPYVIGRVYADKHSLDVLIISWLPLFTISAFTAYE